MASLPDRSPATALIPALVAGGCALTVGIMVLWASRDAVLAAGFLAATVASAGGAWLFRRFQRPPVVSDGAVDWTVARAIAAASPDALAVTDRAGRLVCANDAWEVLFEGFPTPPALPVEMPGADELSAAGRAAWRDGAADPIRVKLRGLPVTISIERAGEQGDLLVWRCATAGETAAGVELEALIEGSAGDRLGHSGVMAATLTPDGRVRASNRALRARAAGDASIALAGQDFARFLITDGQGMVRFEREGLDGNPLRVLQLPWLQGDDAPILVALLDEEAHAPAIGASAAAHVRSLISLMPFGMALVDRDGRFLHMNKSFARAAQIDEHHPPLYPGDLVEREDKAAVADAVRRFAGGQSHSTDMAVRLKGHPDEPVMLTIAGARGLGEAAVLMSLKDNSEESRLKREVAQATKMQAVGQLAGGVAHDFNNILTAIIGHCDLMLMRHQPGDSDYDDIQQIKTNSNRAASLTRQLLAFSRQQTLRPEILQLPDVISEVSTLLKRLLGATVQLEVSHGRGLGAVRADPGQLEQVVVNLAVNGRDAILAKNPTGGGKLTIQTLSVTAADVRALGNEVLPVGDYTALKVTDTGTGIPEANIGKIFEPFFTTKELGKGTGLGLSTVYGIVKQSGGFIFADSPPGQGASFVVYLPIHEAGAGARDAVAPAPAAKPKSSETWGTGTILLVEDEDMVRAVAERALVRQGYTVHTAEHGEAALELLEGGLLPDLLISDVVMPTMDGPTMVRHVRTAYPKLPVLFMSGYAEEQLRKSIDLDNVAFLPKPFSVQQIAEAARDALATAREDA